MADIKLKFLDNNLNSKIYDKLIGAFPVADIGFGPLSINKFDIYNERVAFSNQSSSRDFRTSVDSICGQVDSLECSALLGDSKAFKIRKDAIKELLEELAEMNEGIKHE